MISDNDEDADHSSNFVPVLCFVKAGVAKAVPEKIQLSDDELDDLLNPTDSSIPHSMETESSEDGVNAAVSDRYNFNNYDNEVNNPTLSIADVIEVDPTTGTGNNDDDSDAEDEIIKQTDNQLLVGRMADDAMDLEIYIYNGEEGSFYVHRHFSLYSAPLCIEWSNHDPEDGGARSNMCAIGSVDPIISIWDLDLYECFKPIFKLGSKGSLIKNTSRYGHHDAVLDLSWNKFYPHIVASGSVDRSLILWDLDDQKPKKTVMFEEKVQTLNFHPEHATYLIAGASNGVVRLYDFHVNLETETVLDWNLEGEIERCVWNTMDPNYFFASNNEGKVYYIDIRTKNILWEKQAHQKEVTGVVLNTKGMLTTASADGVLKIWDFDNNDARLVHAAELGIGSVLSMESCPENPYVIAVGGTNRTRNLRMIDLLDFDMVRDVFKDRMSTNASVPSANKQVENK